MSSEEKRYQVYLAVYLAIRQSGNILLLERQNTGFRDGEFSLVSGHVEDEESAEQAAIREAKEEASIDISPEKLTPVHVMHRNDTEREYIDVYYEVEDWDGTIENGEPEFCSELEFYSVTDLPENTIPYVEEAIQHIADDRPFEERGWE